MVDMLKASQNEDQRKRDEAQFHTIQSQLDDLRRQLRENLARQQWSEELYKQNEGKVSQIQTAQERLIQDVAQALHVRQIDEGRIKVQLSELAVRVEAPDKQMRDMRSQIMELAESRKNDRDIDVVVQRQMEDLQRQIRELNSHIAQVGDANKQVRDLIGDLETTIGEVRQEILHVAELQRMEEHRLRRQGVELQGLFEGLRQQFTEIASRSQRVDDVRHQLSERIEAIERVMQPVLTVEESLEGEIERVERAANEQYISQQERLELIRGQVEAQLGEIRQLSDQRTDRVLGRFGQIEDRLRVIDGALSELPSRFESLERRDDLIGSEADTMEEWLVTRQLAAFEMILDDVRKRRTDRAPSINPAAASIKSLPPAEAPGSVYNPSGLIRSVRDAKPPTREGGVES